MTVEPREDVEMTEAGGPARAATDDDGTPGSAAGDAGAACATVPGACLPRSDTVAGWPACASCGLPQAPGKDFCSFCGRRWVSAS